MGQRIASWIDQASPGEHALAFAGGLIAVMVAIQYVAMPLAKAWFATLSPTDALLFALVGPIFLACWVWGLILAAAVGIAGLSARYF